MTTRSAASRLPSGSTTASTVSRPSSRSALVRVRTCTPRSRRKASKKRPISGPTALVQRVSATSRRVTRVSIWVALAATSAPMKPPPMMTMLSALEMAARSRSASSTVRR